MRYLNWDVLLFPGSSRIPIQEFDTKCHVVADPNDHFTDSAVAGGKSSLDETESMSLFPILTSFIPSLEHGTPFRVSVHSWESPRPSQILRTFKTQEETIAYEARVYIDGIMVAHRIFDQHVAWPEVIETSGDMNLIQAKSIHFPPFHSEILNQAHWTPSETYGRIRVVIAEGVTASTVRGGIKTAFDRLRDVITFSFQHAPRPILDQSGIAWPNARLFRKGGKVLPGGIASRVLAVPDFEAHAHSPQRQQQSNALTVRATGSTSSTPLATVGKSREIPSFDDPFIGPAPVVFRGKQSSVRLSSSDAHVQDYSSIRTVRSHAGTDMSGVSYQKPDFERAMREAALDEIVQALSPERRLDLLEALSPEHSDTPGGAKLSHKPSYNVVMPEPLQDSAWTDQKLPWLPNSVDRGCVGPSRGSLFTSRYASLPLLTATLNPSASHVWSVSPGLHSTIDPSLPVDWSKTHSHTDDDDLNCIEKPPIARHRSSSNTSKRKRQDSSNSTTPAKSHLTSYLSTSPCKTCTATEIQVSESPTSERKVSKQQG